MRKKLLLRVIVTFLSHKFGFFSIPERSLPENTIFSSENPYVPHQKYFAKSILEFLCYDLFHIRNTSQNYAQHSSIHARKYYLITLSSEKPSVPHHKYFVKSIPGSPCFPLKFNHLCQLKRGCHL